MPTGSSWEPVPAYSHLCQFFREANNSRDCTWNVITTVWEARGMKAYGGNGTNQLIIRVDHRGIKEDSKTFERAVNTVSNRVYKREFTGQPYDFFASSIIISCWNKKMIGEQFIGQIQLGIMDVFLSKAHMLPMQWFPIVDPKSDLPSEPLGYLKLNCIINNLDESGAVQEKAPDAVADWELNRHEILQIPRMNMRKVACHQYNLKFMTFQGFDLGTGAEKTADPIFRVTTPCGVIATDANPNTLKPQWNTMLQIPYYEPTFCDLIHCEVWDGNAKRLSGLIFSWKDIFINQQAYMKPRWIDMYERKSGGLHAILQSEIPLAGQTVGNALEQNMGFNQSKGFFEERSVYCGRVLLAIEVEEREFRKEPSPANIALKPKDCADMWSDAKQKMFFRFHCFYGQEFSVDQWPLKYRVQVEFQVGRKRVLTKPAEIGEKGLYEFFQAVELELELPMDDQRDNPDGWGAPSLGSGCWNPECFVSRMPDIWVKVFKVSMVGVVMSDAEMIGFWKGDVRTVLGGGDVEMWSENCYIGTDDDNQTNKMFKGIEPIIIPMGDEAPAPSKRAPWGREGDEASIAILNPYQGYQYVMLQSDISCSLGPSDPAGFIGFSAKLWMPTRYKCANGPPKGPPVLSPWTAWNVHRLPPPWDDLLKWTRFFNVKAHIYQARSLGARNDTGVASAYVELKFLSGPATSTHTAFLTNNPTFDTTLVLNDQELFLLPDNFSEGAEEYILDAEDQSDVKRNWKMLSLSPRFEVRVWEKQGDSTVLLGRNYINPAEVLPRKTNPKLIELFKGNPEIEEGFLLCSFQVIETNEKIAKEPPAPLVPDKSKVDMDDPDSWCSKAPIRRVDMFESKIQIQVLGLRDLSSPHPFGWPIANPQIEVCCDDPKTAQTTKSSQKPSGTNANFMECVEIDVRMPVDKRFAPFLDFYVYDHSTLGLSFEIPSIDGQTRPPIVAYGSMATEDFYPADKDEDSDGEMADGEVDENDEAAKKKAKEKEMKKKFAAMIKELKKEGQWSAKEINQLNMLFLKKDEAVVRAFQQYIDAPDSMKFIERVESFFTPNDKAKGGGDNEGDGGGGGDKKKKTEDKKKLKDDKKLAAITESGEEGDAGPGSKRPVSTDSKRPVSKDSAAAETDNGDAPAPAGAGAEDEEKPAGGLDEADAPEDDDDEEGDEQGDDEGDNVSDIVEGHAVEGDDDMLPDMQEKVDTPDGKPNAEWLLLRAHPLYDCPLERSTVKEYGKKGAWEPRFEDAFDELVLYRGPIHNFKQIQHESVGILKCKVKLFRKEDEAVAESRGDDPRFLDMAELKAGKEVPYEVPDVNENFQSRDIEIRIYLLKAFQMTPSQVVDGLAKSDNFIKISLGSEEWDWRTYYDPIVALNPHFYRCAKISAKLPGPSQLHIALMDDQVNVVTEALKTVGVNDVVKDYDEIGETIVDLEDRWFCEEWSVKTVNKPRETRDLFNSGNPGISVGKMMVIVDAVLRVDADDKPEKDVNIAGRQMPLEMRLIIWNLRNCAPKDGYTSDVKVFAELLGWGRMKETDCDMGVKVSRYAMFNYRIKFKGLKFPSPDPTIPAKDYILNLQVWGARLLGNDTLIAEGLLPLQPIFQDCMQRNLGKPSPDDMEIVSLEPAKPADVQADEEGTKYPFRWYSLCHPGGPGCKTNKDFKQPGYDFVKNRQAEIQITVQVMPRAKARAMPASLGFKPGPAKLFDPNRPPQPKNPIFDPEGCKAYIVYVCKEAINRKKPCCCCLSCCIILIVLLVVYVYLLQAGIAPKIPIIPGA